MHLADGLRLIRRQREPDPYGQSPPGDRVTDTARPASEQHALQVSPPAGYYRRNMSLSQRGRLLK